MNPEVVGHEWSEAALLSKAIRYVGVMDEHSSDDWRFAMWSALALEHLCRAALAHVSPALLADNKDWKNVYHALGGKPHAEQFVPHSITMSEVTSRLSLIAPEFTKEMKNFCVEHTRRRNGEVHSGETPFDGLNSSAWQPQFYRVCDALLTWMGLSLESLFDELQCASGRRFIEALKDDAAKAVQRSIVQHKKDWTAQTAEQKKTGGVQAKLWAHRSRGHRVECPACRSTALIEGSPISSPVIQIEENVVVEKQTMIPETLRCVACGLKIYGYSQLQACQLGDTFIATNRYEAADYFANPEDEDYGPDPDFNEPDFDSD